MSEVEVQIPLSVYLPCYRHLLNSTADINFLWGGRDSGKSYFIAQQLIKKCLRADYFRCILVKKTSNSIHDAQWQTIKDIATEWGLLDLFRFKEYPLSIECVNGNKFLARGCDDPGNLKSIKDPSDVWYEELNQLTLIDFITVATTLRSEKVKIQQWCSFNPEAIGAYEEFWLYKLFFKDRGYNFSDKWIVEIPKSDPIEFEFTSTHTTYHDNTHIKPARIAFLEQLAIIDPYYYTVYALGKWGNVKVGALFIFTFSKDKHIKRGLESIPYLPIILSFDFNIDPITCISGQCDETMKDVRILDEFRILNSDIYELCARIEVKYRDRQLIIAGDASGQNKTALKRDLDFYTVIRQELRLGMGQFKLYAANPPIKKTRLLCNALLAKHPNYFFSDRVPYLITDIENTQVDAEGGIDESKDKHQGHLLSCFRYFNYTFLHKWLVLQDEKSNVFRSRDTVNVR